MIAATLVTLKQHRFEIAFAALASIAVALWALVTEFRLTALGVPARCIHDWLVTGPAGREDCLGAMRQWGSVLYSGEGIFNGQGPLPLAAMPLLPFVVGLLGGVPLVARELEARTAQTAWSLYPSRARWLFRQLAPVALVLGVSVAFAALAASPVAAARAAWGFSASLDLGLHGPLVLIRAFAAFGIGLFVGAVVGRALPAFMLGGVLCFTLLTASGLARGAWVAGLGPVVLDESRAGAEAERVLTPRSIATGNAWIAPDGRQISMQEARRIATAGGVPPPKSSQDTDAAVWLDAHGYRSVVVGITDEMALGWGGYEAAGFGAVGVISLSTAFWLVQRRRPK